ncbi:MAG: hypothetical protein RB292_00720 [Patescibacteria group bacterium]|jgi:hypothetical protein|nr:hypothetical protein [Patescibacteria group bacterium]
MKQVILILVLGLMLAGCGKPAAQTLEVPVSGVPETGLVLDVSSQTGQTATVTPGDVLYLKLISSVDSPKQWMATSPTSGDYLILKDHKTAGLAEESAKEIINEWWFKVAKVGNFNLGFIYGEFGKTPDQVFDLTVVSQ